MSGQVVSLEQYTFDNHDYIALQEAEAREYTTKALRALLERLAQSSPFYQRKFQSAGLSPKDFNSLADLAKFPFTTKDDLRKAYPLGIQAVPDREVVRIHSSSGTTGKPVIIPYTAKDVSGLGDDDGPLFCHGRSQPGRPGTDHARLWPLDGGYRISGRRGAVGRHGGADGTG